MLKLFATKGTISFAVALVLEEVGTEYELCLIDFATEDQRSQANASFGSICGAIYSKIAAVSVTMPSSVTKAGTRPFGLTSK